MVVYDKKTSLHSLFSKTVKKYCQLTGRSRVAYKWEYFSHVISSRKQLGVVGMIILYYSITLYSKICLYSFFLPHLLPYP